MFDDYYDGLEDDIAAVIERNYSTTVALVLLLVQYTFAFSDEYHLIWSTPMNRIKWIYVFSQYFGLAVQCTNLYLALGMFSQAQLPLHHNTCRVWAIFMHISVILLLAAVDIIIMLRVYALYMKDARIGTLLLFLFIVDIGCLAYLCFTGYTQVVFDSRCNLKKIPPVCGYVSSVVMAIQTLILGMSFSKMHSLPQGIRIVQTVVFDGTWVLVLLWSAYLASVPLIISSQLGKLHTVYVWPISLFSIAACKMITNMQRIAVGDTQGTSDSEICLTTVVHSDAEVHV